MPKTPTDPLAAILAQGKPRTGGTGMKVEAFFGDRPEVLQWILKLRHERKLSYVAIAELITNAEPEHAIGSKAIENWVVSQKKSNG